jgi:hypothetical protein
MRDACHCTAPIAALNISTLANWVGTRIAVCGKGIFVARTVTPIDFVRLWHKADIFKMSATYPFSAVKRTRPLRQFSSVASSGMPDAFT